jgi:hypothetical protein
MSPTQLRALATLLFASTSIVACGGSDEVGPAPDTDAAQTDAVDAGSEVDPDGVTDDAGTDATTDSGVDGGTDSGAGDAVSGDTVQSDTVTDATDDADATTTGDADTTTGDADTLDDTDTDVLEPGGWFADPRWPSGVWGQETGQAIVFADGYFFADVGPAALAGIVVQVDYDASQFVVQVADASESPLAGRWVRMNWLLSDSLEEPRQGWFCIDEDGESGLDAALALTGLDSANLDTGCYGQPWNLIYPRNGSAFTGNYQDEFGGFQEIGPAAWRRSYDGITFEEFSYVGWISSAYVARNADTNEFFPGQWSRFEVVVDGDALDQLWYCQTVFDGATLLDAVLAPLADASSLTTNGCGGFPWTSMLPQLD